MKYKCKYCKSIREIKQIDGYGSLVSWKCFNCGKMNDITDVK